MGEIENSEVSPTETFGRVAHCGVHLDVMAVVSSGNAADRNSNPLIVPEPQRGRGPTSARWRTLAWSRMTSLFGLV
jgi:hypothetical protein